MHPTAPPHPPTCLPHNQAILDSAWRPTLNPVLLEALGGGSRRAALTEL